MAGRSDQVRTSPGSVERGDRSRLEPGVRPADQAWTEVEEELGLRPPDVWLVRSGLARALTSPGSGKRFRVYPFLFDSAAESEVTLNWEHSEVTWVLSSRLSDPDCVAWQRDIVQSLLAQTGL